MRIAILNESDATGSAYKIVVQLCRELIDGGARADLYARLVSGVPSCAHPIDFPVDLKSRLARMFRRMMLAGEKRRYKAALRLGYDGFHGERTQYGGGLVKALPECDVINLQFVWNFLDYGEFLGKCDKPIVWTLHDMNVFTGGCHYDGGCGRWRTGCGQCPQLRSKSNNDCTSRTWERKRRIFDAIDQNQLNLVAPSRWMASRISESPLLGRFPCHVIPYGLDLKTFQPREQALAREVLGLPVNRKIILFVAQSLSNRRKGFDLLVQSLHLLGIDSDVALVSVGYAPANIKLPVPYFHLGYYDKDGLLSLVYSAADVFVIPSLEDNLPCTVMESLACGTPVIGFDSGGIPDLVRNNETGTLVPRGDVHLLARAMSRLLTDHALSTRLRAQCRLVTENEYSGKLQARRYEELFRQTIASFDERPFGAQGC
jgi:glycosyltransferase involved in cell wall biosynthesis